MNSARLFVAVASSLVSVIGAFAQGQFTFTPSPVSTAVSPIVLNVGQNYPSVASFFVSYNVAGGTISRIEVAGLPPGLTLAGGATFGDTVVVENRPSAVLQGTPTTAGTFVARVVAIAQNLRSDSQGNLWEIHIRVAASASPPAITTQPASQTATAGGNVTLTAAASGTPAPTYQWQFNGGNIADATSATLALGNFQPANAGLYTAIVTNASGTVTTNPAVVGITTTSKVVGTGSEVGPNIVHGNGNVYDQILLQGASATITADPGEITRISYVDLTNDIVQVEFSGAGTLTLLLDNASGPAVAQNYNQPTVTYMKGHGSVIITGANETTNVSIFSVGRITAVNQALFRSEVTYDGLADIAYLAITSTDGKFGGIRTANTSYLATRGRTGIYAPDIQFSGPVFIGDLTASDSATPVLLLGSAGDTRVNGGDLLQANGQSVRVSGVTQLRFVNGSTSHGTTLAGQANRAAFERDGTDVTGQIVVNPGP